MDCRTFRQHHCLYVDDVLPGADVVAMELHRAECRACATFDAQVRRSLLVVRNLPELHCSEGFTERLLQRLREIDVERTPTITARRLPSAGTFAAVAGMLLLTAVGAMALLDDGPRDLVLHPVVATRPAPLPDPLSGSALAASASASVPMWPALFLADEMPMHVAETGFQLTGLH
jgi:hypothetical protein